MALDFIPREMHELARDLTNIADFKLLMVGKSYLTPGGIVACVLFILVVAAGASSAHIKEKPAEAPRPVPIQVRPVLDDTPLLKQGGKVKTKLPEMWKKQAPVQRFEEKSAPSTKACNCTAAPVTWTSIRSAACTRTSASTASSPARPRS